MLTAYLIISLCAAAITFSLRNRFAAGAACWSFYGTQLVLAVYCATWGSESTALEFFTADRTAALFTGLLAVISPVVFYYSSAYLDRESPLEKGVYNSLLILLCVSINCVYLSNNIAVTWIFLEATTLCTAGLIYHRRNRRSLEATWKYVFVCSVGIAMAYLGILLFGGMAGHGGLGYQNIAASVAGGNPLFMRIAFLFILVGYSCKMEIFPLYNIGIDANFAAPTPASALISTGLVNAGFVALYRVYMVMEESGIFPWVKNVLILAGVLSVLIGAVFLRRTSQYKRLFAYSTVENMGIAMIGLGVGGIGVFAALLHVAGHTLLKSAVFLQIAQVGKTYGHYRVNRTGDYMRINRGAAVTLLISTFLLLAFPPSPLFVSELLIFKQMLMNGQWWLLIIVVLMFCTVIYNLGRHIIRLCYQPGRGDITPVRSRLRVAIPVLLLVAAAIVVGAWRPEWLVEWINAMKF